MKSIAALLHRATELALISDTAKLDTELLLAFCLNKERTYLRTWPEKKLTEHQLAKFESLFKRRLQGEPVAYLMGEKGFWDLQLKVNKYTLIPRPETELIIETCLEVFPNNDALKVLDLGTGTGAIALALAKEKSQWQLLAVDKVYEAIDLAKDNQQLNKINNVDFLQSHWFEKITPQAFDIIVSNPPYIDQNDPHLSQGDVRFEPRSALVAENNGLKDIADIIQQAPLFLNDHGLLMFEHGFQQAEVVQALFAKHGFIEIKTLPDLAGLDRVTFGVLKKGSAYE